MRGWSKRKKNAWPRRHSFVAAPQAPRNQLNPAKQVDPVGMTVPGDQAFNFSLSRRNDNVMYKTHTHTHTRSILLLLLIIIIILIQTHPHTQRVESEKRDKYVDVTRELKKTMEREGDGNTNCNWCTWNNPLRIGKGTGRLRNKRRPSRLQHY